MQLITFLTISLAALATSLPSNSGLMHVEADQLETREFPQAGTYHSTLTNQESRLEKTGGYVNQWESVGRVTGDYIHVWPEFKCQLWS
jgi:hypothetical protein